MEEQLVRLLTDTQCPQEAPRKQAELQLEQLFHNETFSLGLLAIASHNSVPLDLRQAALLTLRKYVNRTWSSQPDECTSQPAPSDETKRQLRHQLLNLATNTEERKIKVAASYVVSKIASSELWPDLLPNLLNLIPDATDVQLHGILKVLGDLVDDCFNEAQLFQCADTIVKAMHEVATSAQRNSLLRALAVSVFRSCLATLELVIEVHKQNVKRSINEATAIWLPFFVQVLETRLPDAPAEHAGFEPSEAWRGLVALKMQVVKALMTIRSVFSSALSPHGLMLFNVTWNELSSLQGAYQFMYVENDRQSRLEDVDGLPYTLDFLILEELDFLHACLKTTAVREELSGQLGAQGNRPTLLIEVMKLAVVYAQITTEEEGLWDVDVNIFLSEETSVTANYTPRTACGDLIVKLGEWQRAAVVEGLLSYARSLYATGQPWKIKEAALYLLNQVLGDFINIDLQISAETETGFIDFVRDAMRQDEMFLSARGYLAAGNLCRTSGGAMRQMAASFMDATVHAVINDGRNVVRVACIKALQHYFSSIPPETTLVLQETVINAISAYLSTQDLGELDDSDDLMVTLVETLRDAIRVDPQVCLESTALDVLFAIASHGKNNPQLTTLIGETFEGITETFASTGPDHFTRLCQKVLPTLTGVLDNGALGVDDALTTLAAELLSTLADNGSEPLPQGFVSTVMPRLNHVLLQSNQTDLLKPATYTITSILHHDHRQLFQWHNETGNGGLEVALAIIDRLLRPEIAETAVSEAGNLAAEVIHKAGAEKLGPYMGNLLRAVAVRLGCATQVQSIQRLILVFARLSLDNACEVVDFLANTQIGQHNALQVVMNQWLENSAMFTGYDAIRQNIFALSNLYDCDDPRLAQIMAKGELIVPRSNLIMTRSRARQNPDEYTIVSARLKILKVLIGELMSASGRSPNVKTATDELYDDDDDGDDDDDWQDLSLGVTKAELMGYDNDDGLGSRTRDDETQAYLTDFFRRIVQSPGFNDMFAALTLGEQEMLRSIS